MTRRIPTPDELMALLAGPNGKEAARFMMENLAAAMFDCDHCDREAVFVTVGGEQLCDEHLAAVPPLTLRT